MKKDFKLLIFDLDGTLIDSARDIINATNELLSRHQKAPLADAVITAHIGEGPKKLVHSCFPNHAGIPELRQQIEDEFLEIYGQHLLRTTTVFTGVEDFLRQWPHQIAIVSNKPENYTHQTVSRLALRNFRWVRVLGGDSLPEKKPHPLPLQEVMRAAGCAPHETVMIGDGTPDMRAAKAAGVTSIAVEFGYTALHLLKVHEPHATLAHYSQLSNLLRTLAGI